MLLINREIEQCFSLIRNKMIAQNEINVQGGLAKKTDNRKSIVQEGFQYKLNNGACTIIPYLTVEMKHIWQVYVTGELKIRFFYFFDIRAMV